MTSAFETAPRMPAFWATSTNWLDRNMENSNIGVSGLSLPISHADCSPFISGMAKSRTITSGFNSRALLTASRPSTASPQISQSGCRPSRLRTCCRTSALSSATRIRAGKSASIKHWDQQRSGINLCRRKGGNIILLQSQEYVNGTMAIDEWHGGAPIETFQVRRQSPTGGGKNSISPLFWEREGRDFTDCRKTGERRSL